MGVNLNVNEISAGKISVGTYGFNMVASKKISMDRRIMDTRMKQSVALTHVLPI